MLRSGMKVESIIDWPSDESWSPPNKPAKNGVYIIRDVCSWYGDCYLRLNEIRNTPINDAVYGMTEPGFAAYGFRRIVETDISVFQKLLQPKPERVE